MHESDVVALMGLLLLRTLVPRRVGDYKPITAPVVSVEIVGSQADNISIRLGTVVAGQVHIGAIHRPNSSITVPELVGAVAQFLGSEGIAVPVKKRVARVYLLSHDAKAVLGRIDGVNRDARIRQLGAESHHADFAPVLVGASRWSVSLLDHRAYYNKYDVEAVGRSIDFGSVEDLAQRLPAMHGPEAARQLALDGRLVAIVALAFDRLRENLITRWRVDPLRNRSLPSIAGAVFMKHFARTGPAPWKKRRVVKPRRMSSGAGEEQRNFRVERRNEKVFAGDQEVRIAAARAQWGGAMTAFRRGLIVGQVVELDAVSLYPHAAIIQPLPWERTRWRALNDVTELEVVEGFATAEFEFPVDCEYPNLPTVRDGVNRLLFTRRGTTTCTVSELRVAQRLGASLKILDGRVFTPRERERHHDLGQFMRVQLADKAAALKGTIGYEAPKLMANALIGKMLERYDGSTILDFERTAQIQGFSAGMGTAVANSSVLHQALKRSTEAGALFALEWIALILGLARAIMSEICAKGQVYLVSTDGIIVPAGTDLSCPGLDELRAVGSDLRLEHEADAAFIARNRCYALLKEPDNVSGKDTVLASDGTWCVIRTARHGSRESPTEFAETVLACLAAGRDVAPKRVRTRRVGAQEAVRRGVRINDQVSEPHRTEFGWDSKRRLLERDVNPFTGSTATVPYDTVGAMEGAERQTKKATRKQERRQRKKALVQAVVDLLADGLPVDEVARRTGVSVSSVEAIKIRMPTDPGKLAMSGDPNTPRVSAAAPGTLVVGLDKEEGT